MQHHVAAIEGRFRVYRHIGDRHRLDVGGWFTSRKEAARYADTLSQSADESTARSAAPLRVGVRLDSSADGREPINRARASG